jgi:5-(carboxyamino)imidazole ribonucleotide synthase
LHHQQIKIAGVAISLKIIHMLENYKIGILGGGQLGAMLLRHAIDFGLNVYVLDNDVNAPCSRYTAHFCIGDPMSYEDVVAFGKDLDIITIEKEAVNVQALKRLKDMGVKVYPSPDTIEIIQDKYIQKQFLKESGIPVVPGWLIADKSDLILYKNKFPLCLKKCRNGYDGKGVMILKTPADIESAFDEPCVLEELVEIEHEISVIVSRNEGGAIECYDPVLMVFDNERMILDFQMCPANIETDVAISACNLAIKTAEALKLTGIMAVEMFIATNGKLYVNELAPRPHNSGHHTIEAHTTSQFEQQMRIILGLAMGSTKLNKASVMINILEPAAYRKGIIAEALKTILCTNDVHLHWYGKKAGNEGRKMGHVTIAETNIENALSKAVMIRHLLKGE